MPEHLIGVDIDLRKIYAWSNKHGPLLNAAGLDEALHTLHFDDDTTLLLEVGSAKIYGLDRLPRATLMKTLYHKLRWLMWNTYAATMLASLPHRVLVSPSSTWKHGHDAKSLHKILGLKGMNKDLRECQAMTMMYQKHTQDWQSMTEYMTSM